MSIRILAWVTMWRVVPFTDRRVSERGWNQIWDGKSGVPSHSYYVWDACETYKWRRMIRSNWIWVELRRKVWTGGVNLGIISINMVFKSRGINKTPSVYSRIEPWKPQLFEMQVPAVILRMSSLWSWRQTRQTNIASWKPRRDSMSERGLLFWMLPRESPRRGCCFGRREVTGDFDKSSFSGVNGKKPDC